MSFEWDSWIQNQPFLAVVPSVLREAARLRPFGKGEVLFRRGERPTAMLCVLDGEVRLVRHTAGGADVIHQRSRAGFVAEASLESKAYHCNVMGAADGILLAFPIARFRVALASDPAFHSAWSAQLAREIRKLRARCERLSLNSAAERILHYIESEGTEGIVTLTQSRKALAAELGLAREVLYRTLRRLRDDGTLLVEADRMTLRKR